MKRILLDTNILLDVFLERHPFCQPAQIIWTLAEKKKIQAAISAISINNIFFIMKKLTSNEKAYWAVETLLEIFKIIGVTPQIIRKALKVRFPDFEDAIQYQTALKFRAHAIISRDPSGFEKSTIPVLDGPQFLILSESRKKNS